MKSTIVTFPKLSLKNFPFRVRAAKSEVHLASPIGAAVAQQQRIDFSKFCFTDFPALVF
jgi:hypothetical protein